MWQSYHFYHLDIVGCLLKKRLTMSWGGHSHPRNPFWLCPSTRCLPLTVHHKNFPQNSFESTTTYTLQTCDIAWFTSPRPLELMACVRGAATTPILVSTTPSGTVPFSPPAIPCDTCLLADGRDKFARNLAA